MPLVGFENDQGERVKFEDAWKLERFGGLPVEVLHKMYLEQLGSNRPDGLSVTNLLGCARKAFLEKRDEFYENPRFMYARFRGTMIHSILEGANQLYKPGEIISENRYFRKIPRTNILLSGKIDKYIVSSQTLEDYKTIDDTKIASLVKELPEDYIWQANIYKWILEGQGLPVRRIRIHFFSFKYCYTSGEENLIQAKWSDPRWEKIPACPIYTKAQVEDFITHRVKDIMRSEMPPVVETGKRWMCMACPFAKTICWPGGTPR